MRFWYYLWSSTISNTGFLNVYVLNTKTNQMKKYWTIEKSQGASWKEGGFSFQISDPHRIIFEGVRGPGVGDYSLDDFTLIKNSDCGIFPVFADPSLPTTTTTTTTTTPTSTTPTTPTTTYTWLSQSPYDCNFDVDLCSWQLDVTSQVNWTRLSGATSSFGTGNISLLNFLKNLLFII